MAPPLPSGLVTFCLTDIEGSTPLWDAHAHTMAVVVARHDELVDGVVARNRGLVVHQQGEGDSTVSVFERPADALRAAAELHGVLANEPWPDGIELRVRVGVHTGVADVRDGRYFGSPLNRAARLRGLGAGGQTLVSSSTAELVRDDVPTGTELRDVGDHELKGFARAERVYLLVNCGDPTESLAVRADVVSGRPTLPVASNRFVGRQADLTAVNAALRDSRLVTILGPGGSGKTRLAVEVASRAQTDGIAARGVIAVDLAPVTDPNLVPQTVGLAAGMRSTGDVAVAEAIDRIAAALGDRSYLVLLDNCEHVVSGVAMLVEAVLRSGAAARVLATSQVPLNISSERIYSLAALNLPSPADGDVAAVGEADAVRLFVERAQAHDAAFALSDSNAAAVAGICHGLDGIPLAIELAAAHVRMLEPGEILDRLVADPLALLNKGTASAVDRQKTLRSSIEWSVGLLDAHESTLLRRLAVFEGGFTLAAAEAVCATSEVPAGEIFAVLGRLVDRSLVARRRRGDTTRYWMLETIRAYANEQLLAGSGEQPVLGFTLTRDGDEWSFAGPDGRATRVRNAKGIRYLARLIGQPGVEMHAQDLVASEPAAGGTRFDESALPVLDDTARRTYRDRLRDLAEDLEEARSGNDLERAARIDVEIEALQEQLLAAAGLGDRTRTVGSSAERARASVTKAIRQAIDRLGERNPDVAKHLVDSVRTGTYCCYDPGEHPPVRISGAHS